MRKGGQSGASWRRYRYAAVTAGLYALLGAVWIYASDTVLESVVRRTGADWLHTVKGLAFVGVTTLILFVLLAVHRHDESAAPSQMLGRLRTRVKRLTLVISAVLLAVIVGSMLLHVATNRAQALREAQGRLEALATSLGAHMSGIVHASGVTLAAIVQAVEQGGAADAINSTLERYKLRAPFFSALGVVDGDGRAIYGTNDFLLQKHSITGAQSLVFRQPIVGTSGLAALVLIDLSYLEAIYRTLTEMSDETVALVGRDGRVLGRWPLIPKEGKNLIFGGAPLQNALSRTPHGSFTARGLDGAERLLSYRSVEGQPLVVVVSLPTDDALAAWQGSALRFAAVTLALLAVSLWLVSLTWREMNRQAGAEARLRAHEAQLGMAQRLSRVGSWEMVFKAGTDPEEATVRWSDEMWQVSPPDTEAPYIPLLCESIVPDDRQRVRAALMQTLRTQEPLDVDFRIERESGVRQIKATGRVVPEPGSSEIRLVGAIQDVTELREMSAGLEVAREQLKALSVQLLRLQEDERRTLSHELHDEIGQTITLLIMELRTAARSTGSDPERLESCIDIARGVLDQVRDMSLALRPPQLDELGLSAALEWLLGRNARVAGWYTQLHTGETRPRYPPDVETVCFRIAQEALTNAARHADATRVQVRLREVGDLLELVIADNGRGFPLMPVAGGRRRPSIGLISMRERAATVGGTLSIETRPGRGTTVAVRLPLLQPAHSEDAGSADGGKLVGSPRAETLSSAASGRAGPQT